MEKFGIVKKGVGMSVKYRRSRSGREYGMTTSSSRGDARAESLLESVLRSLHPWRRALIGAGLLTQGAILAAPALAQIPLDGPSLPVASEPEPASSELDSLPVVRAQPGELELDGVYTIQKGDTLWDLSQHYLNNPWYWPKIWADNPYIENPHWIYPGNPLVIRQGQDVPVPEAQEDDGWDEPLPQQPLPVADFTMGSIDQADTLGQDEDIVSISGGGSLTFQPQQKGVRVQIGSLLTSRELAESGTIVGSFEERGLLSTFDQVYIRFKDLDSVRVGDSFSIFRPGKEVMHPRTRRSQGFMTDVIGSVRVVGKDAGVAVGRIEHVLDYAERGDRVGPAAALDKAVEPTPNLAEASGYIIGTHITNQMEIGDFHVVYLDCGSNQGVREGNTFEVLHSGDGLGNVLNRTDRGERDPQEVVAQVMVFDVREDTSAAVVTRAIRETRVGDRVRMRPDDAVAATY